MTNKQSLNSCTNRQFYNPLHTLNKANYLIVDNPIPRDPRKILNTFAAGVHQIHFENPTARLCTHKGRMNVK